MYKKGFSSVMQKRHFFLIIEFRQAYNASNKNIFSLVCSGVRLAVSCNLDEIVRLTLSYIKHSQLTGSYQTFYNCSRLFNAGQ